MNKITGAAKLLLDKTLKEITQSSVSLAGKRVGWNTKIYDHTGNVIGGGTHVDKNTSLKIAFAESLEMLERDFLMTNEEKLLLKFNDVPTRCGLAVGFDNEQTQMRSISEGLERWIWSQWIDSNHFVDHLDISSINLSSLGETYRSFFDEVHLFKKNLAIMINNTPQLMQFGAVIGIKNGGAFPGSRVGLINDDLWTHAFIESYRHWHIFSNIESRTDQKGNIIERIKYFGSHADAALKQVTSVSKKLEWPQPNLDFCIQVRDGKNGYYLYRSLFKDYVPWHLGAKDRFIF